MPICRSELNKNEENVQRMTYERGELEQARGVYTEVIFEYIATTFYTITLFSVFSIKQYDQLNEGLKHLEGYH